MRQAIVSSRQELTNPACLQASLKHMHKISAVLGAAAVLFRQTNAVWVVFIAGVSHHEAACHACQ